jgi:hypothetical protein
VKNRPVLALMLPGLVLVTFIAGCGGGSSTPPPPPPPPPPISVSISATTGIVGAGGTVGLTAMVNNDTSGKGVTWSISPTSGAGMLTNETNSSAMYNAPATPPASDVMVTITATSVADPTQSAPVTIDFAAIQVLLSASVNPVQAGGTSVITAMMNFDPANKGVDSTSWMITCSASPCGTLGIGTNTMVTYTAPSTPPASDVQATITATSVSSPKQMGNTGITFAAIQVSVAPNPATIPCNFSSCSVAEDTTQQFTATVNFDPNNAGVTWALTQGTPPVSCSPACGTLSATNSSSGTPITYNAPSVVPTPATVTLTATSVTDPRQSGSSTITVVNPDAALTGQYAFLFQGFDDATGMQVAVAGSFMADGIGNITGGEEDINEPSGVNTLVTFTGTYVVGLDNRGTATFTKTVGGSVTTYAFALGSFNAGVATKARLIEFDDTSGATGTRGSGFMRLQDSTAFLQSKITGLYGFGISGQDSTSGRIATAGIFSADGMGNVSGGTEDTNDAGTVTNGVSFTGTYSTPDATNGRVTGALSFTSKTTHFSLYVISANEALLMTTDAESTAGLQGGSVLSQVSTTFTNTSLNAGSVFYEVGVNATSPTTQSDVRIGLFTANGSGGLTIVSDENDGGLVTANATTNGLTYSVASNGRVTITGGTGSPPILYLVDTNKAFLLGASGTVGSGFLEPQSGAPFGVSALNGTFLFGVAPPAVTASTVSSGVATATNGCFHFFSFSFRCFHTLRVTQDNSASNGTLTSGATTSSQLTVSSNGRTTMNNAVIYIISPKKFVRIDESPGDVAPVVSIFEQ